MWVHVVIFVMILCALTGWKKGWIPSSGIGGKDGIRLFAVVAIAGNLLGMILTLQNGGQVYPQGYRLEKEDTGSYEKEFMVSVDGEEPVSMYIQVPEKELEEQEEEPKQNKKLTRKEQAQKSIAEAVSRYNEQRSVRCRDWGCLRNWRNCYFWCWSWCHFCGAFFCLLLNIFHCVYDTL